MSAVVLACDESGERFAEHDDIEVHALSERPGKPQVDPLLADLADRRLIVSGTDADLAAVVLRLLRTERLTIPVGYLPAESKSTIAALWGIPVDYEAALTLALNGEPKPRPLIRDDSGGVLLGMGRIGPVRGVGYCDDQQVLRGQASRIQVTPDPKGGLGLVVEISRRGLLRNRVSTTTGRAFQLGCLPTAPRCDGVTHPRPVNRWTWYRHTEDLQLIS